MAALHNEAQPLVRGVFDPTVDGVQPPEFNDGGDLLRVRQIAHRVGSLACVGQCLEPDFKDMAEAARDPSTTLRGSTLRIDTTRDNVAAYTDLSGQWPLYYASQGDRTHYSSDAEYLSRTVGDRLDRAMLAYYIIGGEFIDPGRTAFANINRLPAGHMLRMTRAGNTVEEYAPLVPDKSVQFAETANELQIHLQAAVAPVQESDQSGRFFSLSGGYDSSSLAFLGARLLEPGHRLHAYHTQRLASLSGDTAYALKFAALDPRIDMAHVIIPDGIVPYNALATGNTHYPFSQVDGVVRETVGYELEQLASQGATEHIIGEGGDALFTAPPHYLADLAGHPFENAWRLTREGTLIAHEGEVAFSGLMKAMRAQSGFNGPKALRTIATAIRQGENDGQLTWHNVTAAAIPLLNAKMREHLAELIYDKSLHVPSFPTVGIADFVNINDVRLSGRFTANLRRFSDAYGIATRAPYLDDPVIAARFRLQTHLLADPNQFKSLLRAALGKYVPAEVFERHGKGSYSREAYQGIRKNAQKLRALFGNDSYLASLGIIEPAAFQQLIAKAELGQAVPLDALERAASVELWLREHYGDEARMQQDQSALPQRLQPPNIGPVIPSESLPRSINVPAYIRMAETDIGAVALNMKISVAHNLHSKAFLVLKALQQRGLVEDAAVALRSRYPTVDASLLSQDLTDILTNMLNVGTIEAGEFKPFTINPAQQRSNDAAGEVRMIRGRIDKAGVRLSHYIRMGRGLLKATKLAKQKDLSEITEVLGRRKRGLPPSDEESVRRHMVAGHVLARYMLSKTIVCKDLAAATVLAEAMRGHAADYILAYVPDPNYYHAAPGVGGKPVQTPLDRIMDDNFTVLGVF